MAKDSNRQAQHREPPTPENAPKKNHTPNPAKARFTPQQEVEAPATQKINAIHPLIHAKVLFLSHFGTIFASIIPTSALDKQKRHGFQPRPFQTPATHPTD